jgi:hypothetical protein
MEMSAKYDSTKDTKEHIKNVEHFMKIVLFDLINRLNSHDASKLEEPEKSMYDEFTPKLRELTYGSDEYKQTLKDMGTALQHHYAINKHHPEHYDNGINGMSLLDLTEMFCDWCAASLRHKDGNISKSIEINAKRFEMTDQLKEIFENTLKEIWT